MIETLYGKDKKDGLKVWTASVESFSGKAAIIIEHGKLDGKMQVKREEILEGKQGRSCYEQAVSEANGRIKKQIDKGYRRSKEELEDLPVLAMLAADYRKKGHQISFPCYGSVKYDGVRALVKKKNGVVTVESRTSQPYDIPHLQAELEAVMQEGEIWDGEIYLHGFALQEITSAVKRTDTQAEIYAVERKIGKHINNSEGGELAWNVKFKELNQELAEAKMIHELRPQLQFHIFDVVSDKVFEDRLYDLQELQGLVDVEFIRLTEYFVVTDEAHMKQLHKVSVNRGYEGIMLRNAKGVYESGKRSNDLQKYKEFFDAEFIIQRTRADKDGLAVYELKNDLNDLEFSCIMGSHAEKAAAVDGRNNGKAITVKFQTRYKDTLLPQFGVGVMIRDGQHVGGEFVPDI